MGHEPIINLTTRFLTQAQECVEESVKENAPKVSSHPKPSRLNDSKQSEEQAEKTDGIIYPNIWQRKRKSTVVACMQML
jgi:hypothetical protein